MIIKKSLKMSCVRCEKQRQEQRELLVRVCKNAPHQRADLFTEVQMGELDALYDAYHAALDKISTAKE